MHYDEWNVKNGAGIMDAVYLQSVFIVSSQDNS